MNEVNNSMNPLNQNPNQYSGNNTKNKYLLLYQNPTGTYE